MGMDLEAMSDATAVKHQHFNWTGWGMLGDLLAELGCDLTLMVGYNNGDVVDAVTATAWATALRDGLANSRIYLVEYPDSAFDDGQRGEFHASGTQTPVIISSWMQARSAVERLFGRLEGEGEIDRSVCPEEVYITKGCEDYEWLSEVATFFANSGGFEQW